MIGGASYVWSFLDEHRNTGIKRDWQENLHGSAHLHKQILASVFS